jgi:succinyl-CoA synthetase alpha subunit
MAILIDRNTNIIIQGATGSQGSLHTKYMLECGAKVVGGISPGKGGSAVHQVPIYNTVSEAIEHHRVDATLILVPTLTVRNCAVEAIENGVKTLVIITEHVPVHDSIYIRQLAREHGANIVGPNTIGVISPGKTKVGVMPAFLYSEGHVGIVSRSGTLTHETASTLTLRNIGQSTCVCIGGDPVPGMNFVDILKLFANDAETKLVVLIGEIGGSGEEAAARYVIENGFPKPIIAFIAGQTAPAEKKMGHAGAIISGDSGSAESKYAALAKANIKIARTIGELVDSVNAALQ